ncbi:hypothetical protein PA598K_07069 [Paenibacillus sp. 598K]|uniref:polyprenyl synthetase family protein n=1 Tax=Paenibacillus sp. 598K TaxID=1117987 RepID=UPI000FF93D7B|nr:polyprenyl synthetase family protein [Paenibacillus sp. 598K]GBF78426.1 hypothetical protein PA598K_07069 [Paenibacillus sp. 598K]
MTTQHHNNAERHYRIAEEQASQYLTALSGYLQTGEHIGALTEDFRLWQPGHIGVLSWGARLVPGKRDSDPDERYIRWLHRTGKLDAYLERSVTYLYMRDLGQSPSDSGTVAAIRRMTERLKSTLTRPREGPGIGRIGHAALYRWAQSEGVESAAIWLIAKLRQVATKLPDELEAEHAQRKLMKIIVGVVLHALEELGEEADADLRARTIDRAIRLGYAYGLTYPFIDDLLDSSALTDTEKLRYAEAIRMVLLTGEVAPLRETIPEERPLLAYVYAELSEAFALIKREQAPDALRQFLAEAYVFFHAQELDRAKTLSDDSYSVEELYVPVILKSAHSRLMARAVVGATEDEGFSRRTFYYGLYNQLADDFADLADDLAAGAVTPYTYYMTHRETRPDLLHPYALYWAVIGYLIHHVYEGDPAARDVILSRAINGLKRCRVRLCEARYADLMVSLALPDGAFHRLIQRMVERAGEVDFFDKLLRDRLATHLRESRASQRRFEEAARQARQRIDAALPLVPGAEHPGQVCSTGARSETTAAGGLDAVRTSIGQDADTDGRRETTGQLADPLLEAADYMVGGGGKRLRPVLSAVYGEEVYGLSLDSLLPLLRSLEYMHTASLIFDDLPSQDDAELRRGRPTLHRVYDSATAELTGLLLIQRAVQEQSRLSGYDAQAVLRLIRYSAEQAETLCRGQAMDLRAKGQTLTLEQLETLCYYKTGIGFEAALVMPALLAGTPESELERLRLFARHAGVAFQIRDDLLDAEGDPELLGKPVRQDRSRGRATFVTQLGVEGARRQMWERYCLAAEALQGLSRGGEMLAQALDYMVHRER